MNYIMRYDYDNFDGIFENIVAVRHGTSFKFMECVVKFYQFDDRCILFWIDGNGFSKDEAYEKIRNAAKVLSFMFALNFDSENNVIFERELKLEPNNLLAKKSERNLKYVEKRISRFNINKQFFYDMLDLLNVAYNNLYNSRDEDAFIYFFKVIEQISKKYYLLYMERHHTKAATRKNKRELRNLLKNYTEDLLQVGLTEDMMDRKVDTLYKSIKLEFYGSVFNKISLFIKRNKIQIDINDVSSLVKVRNKIAHGDTIESDDFSSFLTNCEYLANEMFSYHFFGKDYLNLKLSSYRYFKGEDIYK